MSRVNLENQHETEYRGGFHIQALGLPQHQFRAAAMPPPNAATGVFAPRRISAPENLSQLPADKNAIIVLHCRSGRISAIAAEELVLLSYAKLWNLDGGMDSVCDLTDICSNAG